MPLDAQAEQALRSALASQSIPGELQDALLASVSDMFDHYQAGRLRPSELSGGDFVEAAFRILQQLDVKKYTPLGRPLPSTDQLVAQMQKSSLDDSLRIHIPLLLQTMYGLRNRRGVGHLPGPISANQPDAAFLLAGSKWILTEFIRLFHTSSHQVAQTVVDSLAKRHVPLVQDFEGALRVVARSRLSIPESVLVLLYAAQPSTVTGEQLRDWTRGHPRLVIQAIRRLDERNLLHEFRDGRIVLTAPGEEEAERLLIHLQTRTRANAPSRRNRPRGRRARGAFSGPA